MRKILFLLAVLSSAGGAQPTLLISFDPGLNLHNSENSLKPIGNKALDWSPGVSVGFEGLSLWGVLARLEYSYTCSIARNALEFPTTSPSGPMPTGFFGADLSFTTHTFDIGGVLQPVSFLFLTAGPSVSVAYRTIEFTVPASSNLPEINFRDRLASVCLGVNGGVDVRIPLGSEIPRHLLLFAGLRLRYLHSVLFDGRGRNVSEYSQSQLFGRLSVGFGYAF